jgi:hypothetical protein
LFLRHFMLKFASPRYKGNFQSDIKTYRKRANAFSDSPPVEAWAPCRRQPTYTESETQINSVNN